MQFTQCPQLAVLLQVKSNGSERHFQFDVVFEPDAAQDDVFENCGIKRLVDSAVLGYTHTIPQTQSIHDTSF